MAFINIWNCLNCILFDIPENWLIYFVHTESLASTQKYLLNEWKSEIFYDIFLAELTASSCVSYGSLFIPVCSAYPSCGNWYMDGLIQWNTASSIHAIFVVTHLLILGLTMWLALAKWNMKAGTW